MLFVAKLPPARRITAAIILPAIAALASCGGGGGGSGSSNTPSVDIAVSPESITTGQSATLTWSSANVTSCTASGDWSGSQPTSSSASAPTTESPTTAGTYSYTLTCTGDEGSASATATLGVDVPTAQRISAAQATATNTDPDSSCGMLSQNTSGSDDGFYWEIGDANGIVTDSTSGTSASGSVQPAGTSGTNYTRSSGMAIASGSKWLYGAYVAESKATQVNGAGQFPAAYIPFLNFTSGYDNLDDSTCSSALTTTVQDCLEAENGSGASAEPNGTQTPGDVGKFYYNGGHLEVFEGGGDPSIAGVEDGASYDSTELTALLTTTFAAKDIVFTNLHYIEPLLAGGVYTTAGDYASFLQGMIRTSNPLVMASFLHPTASDPYAVCTNPKDASCVDTNGDPLAVYTPLPTTLSWHYSITHWIEDDPTTGDGAYSSPGVYGFYPWVDSTKTYYGILARYDTSNALDPANAAYYLSTVCGGAIRKAFMTGQAQN